MKIAYAPQTMTKEECTSMIGLMREQECGVLDKSYLTDESIIPIYEKRCQEIG